MKQILEEYPEQHIVREHSDTHWTNLTRIPHYHGDVVRQIFIVTAAVMLIGAPFYASASRTELPFLIIGGLILVALAAFANPHGKRIAVGSAVLAGAGLVLFQSWALFSFNDSSLMQFILRQLLAILFLAAFYFSMKTLRGFILGKIGRHEQVGEFDER